MAILANKDTRVVVQGITGGQGSFHTGLMRDYGTQVVAGVVPGKGGEWFESEVPSLIPSKRRWMRRAQRLQW